MPKFGIKLKGDQTSDAGTGIVRNTQKWDLLAPGYHAAVLEELAFATNKWTSAEHGTHKMVDFTPKFKVFRTGEDAGRSPVIIDNENERAGAVDDDFQFYSIWEGSHPIWTPVRFLFGTLGLLQSEGLKEFDPEDYKNLVITVRTSVGAYIKGEGSYDYDELLEMLGVDSLDTDLDYVNARSDNDDAKGIRQIGDLSWRVLAYNIKNGYTSIKVNGSQEAADILFDADDPREVYSHIIRNGKLIDESGENIRLKTKNVLTGFYQFNPDMSDVDSSDFVYNEDNGLWFLNQDAEDDFLDSTGQSAAGW